MLKIKLQRIGRKHDPAYRVVVTDRRTGSKSNKHTATVGHYDSIRKTVDLKADEIKNWISKGAQPTETVHNILVKEGVLEGKKKNVLSKKSPIIKEKEEGEEKPAEEIPKTLEVEEKPAEEEKKEEVSSEEPKEEEKKD